MNIFEGFKVGMNDLEISHHQYADNIILVRVPSMENLFIIKAVLRSFEFASEA